MTWDEYRRLRGVGDTWLIIFVTSGVGGLLNALVNVEEGGWKILSLGTKLVTFVSVALIIFGFFVRRYFYRKSEGIKPA